MNSQNVKQLREIVDAIDLAVDDALHAVVSADADLTKVQNEYSLATSRLNNAKAELKRKDAERRIAFREWRAAIQTEKEIKK